MKKNSTLLPVAIVGVIGVLALIAILSGRSNAPDISGDPTYPHHVCTFNRYCAGEACVDDAHSIVAYLRHADGLPRIEAPGMSPRATLEETDEALIFTSTGGSIEGTLKIYDDRGLDFTGFSGEGAELVEHFASGSCDRRVSG